MIKRLIFFAFLSCMIITYLVSNVKLCILHNNGIGMVAPPQKNNVVPETNVNGIYIYLDKDDYKELKNIETVFNRVLYVNDSSIVNEFIKHSKFKQMGGDMCSCTSFIYFTRNDTILEEYECCIFSKKIGLQNAKFGYLESTSDSTFNLIEHFKDKIGVIFKY